MATAQSLIDAAYSRSLKARPAQFNEPTELLAIVRRSLLECFIAAAAVRPEFFGKSTSAAFGSGGWARPSDAITVYRIENAVGERVVEVPLHDRRADVSQPAVYSMGGLFYGAGNALDPTSGNLTMFYARTPRALTALTGDPNGITDPALVAEWDEIHILALYIHMIGKDAANHPDGEMERQTAERARWMDTFREYVTRSSTSTVARMGNAV
jgi:hypothetical protein